MRKKVYVFLNNKTNTLDIILPLALKIKKIDKNFYFQFYTFNKKNFDDINNNILFRNLIEKLGKLSIFGTTLVDTSYNFALKNEEITIRERIANLVNFKLLNQMFILFKIFYLIIYNCLFKSIFIHFHALEKFPLNILYIFKKDHVLLFDSDPWGHNENINSAYDIKAHREIGMKKVTPYINYDKLISFSKENKQVEFAKKNNKNIFFLKSTRADNNWRDYCKVKSLEFLKNNTSLKNKISGKKVILYLFGTMDNIVTVDNNYNGEKLFVKTMTALNKIKNTIIIIKPHPNADLKRLHKLIIPYNKKNIFIINMHVSVLGNFCNYAISNYMSLALGDAWLTGLKTIEFTVYNKELLKHTKNNSTIPHFADHFVNINEEKVFLSIINKTVNRKNRVYENDIKKNDEDLLLSNLIKYFD